MPNRQAIEEQIHLNFLAFKKMKFRALDEGKFALLKDGELVETLADKMDAHKMGKRLFSDGIYSIQEIKFRIEHLGGLSFKSSCALQEC